MKSYTYYLFIFLFSLLSHSQVNKELNLEDIYLNKTFTQDWVWGLSSMNNGKEYSIIDYQNNLVSIDLYSYKTGKKIKTILSSTEIDSIAFDDYIFNSNEDKILLKVKSEPIYRYSEKSFVYAYDLNTKQLVKVFDKKISLPEFSPNGKMISYVYNNNIYIYDIITKKTTACTNDGIKNKIIYGATDWVYEEEFALVKGYEWSSNSKYIAFLRFDESGVKEFSMDMFQQDLYPSQEKFKYPKAGEKNSKVSIFIFDTDSNTTKKINEGLNKFEYTPRIYWTKNSEKLCFFKLNRHQNHLKLILTSPKTGKTETVYEEKDQAYIDIHDNITFLDDGFIWTSEKDGFNHIYQFYYNTKEMKQITKGDYEITNFYGYNDKNLILLPI